MTEHMLHLGDCLDVLRTMPDCSVDAVVTDPPYGLSFMGKKWDYDVPSVEIWAECLRVLKPGGHLLAFAGTRTQHRMAVRIEDAGFEIRDMIAWVYGSGFPKSLDVSKAIDKAAGEIRPRVAGGQGGANAILGARKCGEAISGEAISGEAQQWAGWGTALKPALEPITMARKPLTGTVAANVLEHGTGALNVDGCRVGTSKNVPASVSKKAPANCYGKYAEAGETPGIGGHDPNIGRWPANLIHDGSDEAVGLFPANAGAFAPVRGTEPSKPAKNTYGEYARGGGAFHNDTCSAARFFYTAKASKNERQGVAHPTVKPIELMAYLCRLVTPAGGTVLDPFMGSGTTIKAALSEGFNAIGIERDPAYFEMAQHRMDGAQMGLSL
jgi:site-specific DNA-methyltransferase (adenine-specific)